MTEEEQERIAIQDIIDESGCEIMQVMEDNYLPPYAYSIGLFQQYNHPEIICFGLSEDVMNSLINNVKDRVEDEQKIEVNKTYKDFLADNAEVCFIPVNKAYYKDYLGYASWFYENEDYPVLQLVWPDRKGNFPWQKQFDKKIEFAQPLLDRNLDFKFYESKKLGVFTSEEVLKGKPIQYVIHDEEGDWFFLENDEVENDDLQIVSLEQIIKLDDTLNSIFYLQYGWEARRTSIGDEWIESESEWIGEDDEEDDE